MTDQERQDALLQPLMQFQEWFEASGDRNRCAVAIVCDAQDDTNDDDQLDAMTQVAIFGDEKLLSVVMGDVMEETRVGQLVKSGMALRIAKKLEADLKHKREMLTADGEAEAET